MMIYKECNSALKSGCSSSTNLLFYSAGHGRWQLHPLSLIHYVVAPCYLISFNIAYHSSIFFVSSDSPELYLYFLECWYYYGTGILSSVSWGCFKSGSKTIPCTLYGLSHPWEADLLVGIAVAVKLGQDCTKSQL